jgi:hypothetical protein
MPMRRLLFPAALGCLAAPGAWADTTLHVLHINDLHSRIEPINASDSTCSAEDAAESLAQKEVAEQKAKKADEERLRAQAAAKQAQQAEAKAKAEAAAAKDGQAQGQGSAPAPPSMEGPGSEPQPEPAADGT